MIDNDHPIHTACGMATDECICGLEGEPCPKCNEPMLFALPERLQPYIEEYFFVCKCYACGYEQTDDIRDGR